MKLKIDIKEASNKFNRNFSSVSIRLFIFIKKRVKKLNKDVKSSMHSHTCPILNQFIDLFNYT